MTLSLDLEEPRVSLRTYSVEVEVCFLEAVVEVDGSVVGRTQLNLLRKNSLLNPCQSTPFRTCFFMFHSHSHAELHWKISITEKFSEK